ncbi:LPXTG cell wall anchor domain-containing protein [Pseudolysinimonas kribbensis]|uniref:LPXTG cell wall anchor domain-containing protein n=1 Tax=Pseudolysinimonas kribbensis TaxID=433641 RepID=UPI0031D68E02
MSSCTVTVSPGAESTWAVPANASDVSVVVAAGAGGDSTWGAANGGAGGQITVDLGTLYNGDTLHLLAGDHGQRSDGDIGSGGGGSYIATAAGFVVVAGGGGGGGATVDGGSSPLGGAGGYSTASANGLDGTDAPGFHAAGTGAVGSTPGQPSTTPDVIVRGSAGTVASVASDGTITPGVGGSPSAAYPAAQGGGGYAGGGGGGSSNNLAQYPDEEAGAGGGGSGYLAAGLDAVSTAANAGAGSITITYSLQPTISAPSTTVVTGSKATTTVGTLAPGTEFAIRLAQTQAQLGTGTIDVAGDPATVTFTMPSVPAGDYTLELVVGGSTVATSDPFAVTVAVQPASTGAKTLPATGVDDVAALLALAVLLMGAGVAFVALRRRRA